MFKVFTCEMCGKELKAETVDELLKKVVECAQKEHNTTPILKLLK